MSRRRRRRGSLYRRRGRNRSLLFNWPMFIAIVLIILFVAATAGCTENTSQSISSGAPGYSAAQFGPWLDEDRDRCNTRYEVLTRDAIPGTMIDTNLDGCAEDVSIRDPYTGQVIEGRTNIDIDHVVSRHDAWNSGAWRWSPSERAAFSNDIQNLVAARDVVNRLKSDKTPEEWKVATYPKTAIVVMARSGWCRYATTYANVKNKYKLTLTTDQLRAIDTMQDSCPR